MIKNVIITRKDAEVLSYLVGAASVIMACLAFDETSIFSTILTSDLIRSIIISSSICSLVVGYVGKKRRIGFCGAFFISFFASPLVGLVVTLLSPSLADEAYKERVLDLQTQSARQTMRESAIDQLYKLNELRKDGAISQEEFDAEKARVLGTEA